jgi:hypothetical protein
MTRSCRLLARKTASDVDRTRANAVPVAPLELLIDTARMDVGYRDVPVYLLKDVQIPAGLKVSVVRAITTSSTGPQQVRGDGRRWRFPQNISAERWYRVLDLLERDVRHRDLDFAKVRGAGNTFSVRVDRRDGMLLRETDENWEPVFVGPWPELENAARSMTGLGRMAAKDVTREDATREA